MAIRIRAGVLVIHLFQGLTTPLITGLIVRIRIGTIRFMIVGIIHRIIRMATIITVLTIILDITIKSIPVKITPMVKEVRTQPIAGVPLRVVRQIQGIQEMECIRVQELLQEGHRHQL